MAWPFPGWGAPQAGTGSPVKLNESRNTWMHLNAGTEWWSRKHKSTRDAKKFRGVNKSESWFGGEHITNQNRKLVSYKTSSAKDLKERSLASAFFWSLLGFFGTGGVLVFFFLPCSDCFISWLCLTYFLQKPLTRIKETSIAPDIPSPKGAGHNPSHRAESRSFEPTLIFGISILIKPLSSVLLSSSHSKIPKRWLCQLPSLEFKALMVEETF